MELLCFKIGDKYLRIKDDEYEIVNLQKASVYPISDFIKVQSLCLKFKNTLTKLQIKKLIITEEDF